MPAHHLTPRIENAAEYRCRLRHVRKASAIAVLLLGVLLLAGCGESSEEKAKAQVCTAKSDISKQVKTLSELTISTNLLTQAKDGLEAIASDLTTIKDAQPNLAPARKEQISSATHTFEAQVSSIITGLVSNPSLSNAEKQLKASLTQYAKSFERALAPINCS
jgi:outer membrane murein-binding lipoprotein Lpp